MKLPEVPQQDLSSTQPHKAIEISEVPVDKTDTD